MLRILERRLPYIAGAFVAAAIAVVLLVPHSGRAASRRRPSAERVVTRTVIARTQVPQRSDTRTVSVARHSSVTHQPARPATTNRATAAAVQMTLPREIGQLVISTYAGLVPPPAMLAAVRRGQTGAVILMGTNTAGGVARTRASVDELQAAARAGGNPGLLVMTDQEGGEVKRLPGPPAVAASGMSNPSVAYRQGVLTGDLLRQAGVNLDLAPVADVTRTDGFMTQEQRTFGSSPGVVARAVCSFALGLRGTGIGYTLKHFPGLGDAIDSTDGEPVAITESAADIHADDLAYRECGSDPGAAVMVSSASYSHLTGSVPAVLSPRIYHDVMPADGIDALTMSDSFQSGAIEHLSAPAMTAVNAGLDMVMYPDDEAGSAAAYASLLADAQRGALSRPRVAQAAARVLAFKRALGVAR